MATHHRLVDLQPSRYYCHQPKPKLLHIAVFGIQLMQITSTRATDTVESIRAPFQGVAAKILEYPLVATHHRLVDLQPSRYYCHQPKPKLLHIAVFGIQLMQITSTRATDTVESIRAPFQPFLRELAEYLPSTTYPDTVPT